MEGRDSLLLKSVNPLFSERLIFCPEKEVKENFPVKVEGESVPGGIKSQEAGDLQTLLVMQSSPASWHGGDRCPLKLKVNCHL